MTTQEQIEREIELLKLMIKDLKNPTHDKQENIMLQLDSIGFFVKRLILESLDDLK